MNGQQLLEQAARTLREHTDVGWIVLRDDVVALAARAFRPSAPVRGRLGGGELWVASAVLVACVRAAVDRLERAGALRIVCTTTEDHDLDRMTIEVVALYGTPLVELAERVRVVAATVVAQTLGLAASPLDRITVDVSVADVTSDPRTL